jgi:hypothetical protein
MPAERTWRRNFSKVVGQKMRLAAPVSSSIVTKRTPFAVPGY